MNRYTRVGNAAAPGTRGLARRAFGASCTDVIAALERRRFRPPLLALLQAVLLSTSPLSLGCLFSSGTLWLFCPPTPESTRQWLRLFSSG